MGLTEEPTIELYRLMYTAQRWELGLLRLIDQCKEVSPFDGLIWVVIWHNQ